jgi:aminomethyltransferase
MAGGKEHSIMPIGLGARNTLRLEACYSLYGHELTTEITPVEAGIGWVVKEKEADFIGKEVLLSQKNNGISRKIVGLELKDKGIMRDNFKVFVGSNKMGYITSGTFSPTLKKSIALAMLDIDYTEVGTSVLVEIRKKRVLAEVVKTPFYVYKSK